MVWTRFMDMYSGGGRKLSHEVILIEAPQEEAARVFYNRFDRSPHRVTCTCCGPDYSLTESLTLEQATGFERGCEHKNGQYIESPDTEDKFRKYQTLAEYLDGGNALVIRADEIKPEERTGDIPAEGYVWMGQD